jgi:N-acetyl-gamma-glutamyl-phosphate reductase
LNKIAFLRFALLNEAKKLNVAVIGASGYVGAELIGLLCQHDFVCLQHLVVSENSTSLGKTFSELHPFWQGLCDEPLQSFSQLWFEQVTSTENAEALNAVFFATPHDFSAQWAQAFIDKGIQVFDLSGGFRLKSAENYPKYYGFSHQSKKLLVIAQYGLVEWHAKEIAKAQLVAVPGCYPTASLLALKPITHNKLHRENSLIVVNGVSGVTGAGRKASLATNFNEVSLTAYNILQHRHQPEIAQEAQADVVFNPHLAPYKRGLLVTITLQLKANVSSEQVNNAYIKAYQQQPLIRFSTTWPKVGNVAHTPFADMFWQYDQQKQTLVVCCAIDNLLKGAASQAIQCLNCYLALPSNYGLVANKHLKNSVGEYNAN